MAVFASEKSSKDINSNGIVSDDAVVASDVPPRYLLDAFSHLYKRVCPSVGRSVLPSISRSVCRTVSPLVGPSVGRSVTHELKF